MQTLILYFKNVHKFLMFSIVYIRRPKGCSFKNNIKVILLARQKSYIILKVVKFDGMHYELPVSYLLFLE